VEDKGPGFITSFSSASKAVTCALSILKELTEARVEKDDFQIAISAGEPVADSDVLFGDCVQLAEYMCNISQKFRIVMSSAVDELVSKDFSLERRKKMLALTPQDESLLRLLFGKLEENWQNPDFNVAEYCESMAMSQSQLYRKTMTLCGMSAVLLLKNFRLGKAKELMKKQRYNISEITFASGFTSPSYFTKCFKKKYGLLPMAYIDLLH
jgi:AraC-like DNA-binding protein